MPEVGPAQPRAKLAMPGPGLAVAQGSSEIEVDGPIEQHEVKLWPGDGQVQVDQDGLVLSVKEGFPAWSLGVRAGHAATSINGKRFSLGLFDDARNGHQPYTVVFRGAVRSTRDIVLLSIFALSICGAFVDMIARLVHARLSSDDDLRRDPTFYLASPLALGFVGMAAASHLCIKMTRTRPITGSSAFVIFLALYTYVALVFGIWRLRGAGAFLQPVKAGLAINVVNIVLLAGRVVLYGAWVLANYMVRPLPLLDNILPARFMLYSALACGFACALASAADAVGSELESLISLDCCEKSFKDKVHCPVVDFMEKKQDHLGKLGLPLTMIGLMGFFEFFCARFFFWQCVDMAGSQSAWPAVLRFLCCLVGLVGYVCAFAAAPLRISAAVETTRMQLRRVRSQTPELHLQIDAIEAVMEQENEGHGFGVSVAGRLVLSKALLQKVVMIFVSVAALVRSFESGVLGYEQDSFKSLTDQIHALDGQAQNLTREMVDIRGLLREMRHRG